MKIVVCPDSNMNTLVEYLDFNQIPYESDDLWNPNLDTHGRHELKSVQSHDDSTLLIVNNIMFYELCSWELSRNQLVEFCNSNNKIWVWGDIDSLITSLLNQSIISIIDLCVPLNSISLFFDGAISDHHRLTKLCNVRVQLFPYNFSLQRLRIQNAVVDKHNCSKDFMLTTCKKAGRPHRDILWTQLTAISGLVDRGHVNYGSGRERIGQQAWQDNWANPFFPSMDLYCDSWLEIAPETLYRDGYFITEKTVKPIATKTPFLTVSTRYYLEYLKKVGFKTFGNIIDESYDQQPLVEDRIRLMLIQLQDIVKNGAESFYNECASVLEHNQNRLFEIAGRKEYDMDLFITKNLEQDGVI
jgi:hypothetical protein